MELWLVNVFNWSFNIFNDGWLDFLFIIFGLLLVYKIELLNDVLLLSNNNFFYVWSFILPPIEYEFYCVSLFKIDYIFCVLFNSVLSIHFDMNLSKYYYIY